MTESNFDGHTRSAVGQGKRMSAKLAKLPGNGQQDIVGNILWGLDSRLRGKDGRRGDGTESEFMR